MKQTKKNRKKLIIISIVIVLAAVLIVGLWLFWQYREDQKTVEVVPVNQVSDSYWGDQASSSGMVISDYVQELYPDTNKIISEIYVEEGDTVQIGTPLLQYDKETLELDVKAKDIAVKKADYNLKDAQTRLKRLQNTTAATPRPTQQPTVRPGNTPTPGASATPTATPVPPADVTLYSRLDLTSVPYAGSGTSDDPYLFLCTSDCVMTPEFLRHLLGFGEASAPVETPAPGDEDGENSEIDPEEPQEPTPTPAPTPSTTLRTPFAAVFEVREGDSNYGKLISAFKLDGTRFSGNFEISSTLTGSSTIDSVANLFGASPSPNANNYNHMGYTAAELKRLINEVKEEIQGLQVTRRQAELDLELAKLQLKNSTVLSTVDGVVRTLMDPDEAAAQGSPFLVVSGESTYYVAGALRESVLGIVNVGDSVTVNNYMTGMTYTAQIVSIADYPLDQDSNLYYYGAGNPNSSNYEFTAVVEDGDGLQGGQYVDIQLFMQDEVTQNALYIQNAYIREDEGGSYVMKAGIDNRLKKQYVRTGRSLYGYSLEIKSGLTQDEYIAFPYGPDVKEGVRVLLEGNDEPPYSNDDDDLPTISVGSPAVMPLAVSSDEEEEN